MSLISERLGRFASSVPLGSDICLYAALIAGTPAFGLVGASLSPLIWRPAQATSRHLALLIALLVTSVGGHFPVIQDSLALRLADPSAALGLALLVRPSTVAVTVLLLSGVWRMLIPLASSLGLIATALIAILILTTQRGDLESVGYALLALTAIAELLNGYFIWSQRPAAAPVRTLTFAAILACLAVALEPAPRVRTRDHVTIWWPSEPRMEFTTVDNGYGWGNIGHFGELPRLLTSAGYRVTRLTDLEHVSAEILILPVPFRPLRTREVEAIRSAARGGTRLLLIAEHTNLDGVQDSYNAILQGTGIALRFDTTNAVFGDSTLALSGPRLAAHSYITHNRGASITVASVRARSLLKGTWWHSDLGDPLAPERGFLSDYRLSPGDRIGHILLAARVRMGDGEVFLWGDGSPFLNQHLAYNSRFLLETLHDLSGDEQLPWFGASVSVAFLAIWILSRRSEIVGLVALTALTLPLRPSPPVQLPQPLAVISTQEHNLFDRDPFSGAGATGLGISLTRAGFVPLLARWTDLPSLPRAVFVINPQRRITAGYASGLRDAADSGSTVVISGGGDNPSFVALARHFGVSIRGVPLGSLSGDEFTTYSAWGIESQTGKPLVALGHPVGVVHQEGRGRVVIIADSGFFYSKNLEFEDTYDSRNLRFVQSLVSRP